MKIIKLAGKPVTLRITIGDDGTFDARVVGNANGEGCKVTQAEEDENAALIRDLLEAKVPGYGTISIDDSGQTAEGFEAKSKNRTAPLLANPFQQDPAKQTNKKKIMPQPTAPERQLDTGFGV